MTVTSNAGSLLVTAGQSLSFSSLFSLAGPHYGQIEVQLLDDNNYAATNPGAYGSLTGNGVTLKPAGVNTTDITVSIQFIYDPTTGDYTNFLYGSLSNLIVTAPTGLNHGELISILALQSGVWTDQADLYEVVQPAAATLSAATPGGICSIAQTYVGQNWNNNGCWLLTADIAARAGASVPETSSKFSAPLYPLTPRPNGEWIVAYNGAAQSNPTLASALALLRPGDILSFGWQSETEGHSLAVVSGYGAQAMVIDNSGPASSDGAAADIVIQAAHSLAAELGGQGTGMAADPASIQIYRLDTPTIAMNVAKEALAFGQSLPLAPLFSAQDAGGAGHLPVTEYEVYDAAGAAFMVGGAAQFANSAATALEISAASLSQLDLRAGSSSGTDTVYVRASNGSYWGDWASLSVTFSPSETANLAVAQFQSGSLAKPVIVTDTAANIAASLSGLQSLAAAGDLTSISMTGTLSLTAAQVAADAAALGAIAGSGVLTVSDSGAKVAAALGALQSLAAAGTLGSVDLTDGGLVKVTAVELVADSAALAVLAPGGRVAVTDSAAEVAANLDVLQSLAAQGKLASITLSDGGVPTLSISAAQASSDAQALALIGSSYAPAIASTLADFHYSEGHMPFGGLVLDGSGNLFGANYSGGDSGDGTLFEIVKTAKGYDGNVVTLHSFGGADGANPRANVYAVGDVFYGTTTNGGADNDGTVYLASAASLGSSGPTTLVSFNGTDGAQPFGNVIADAAGNLFGTTSAGGANNAGTVFEIVKGANGYAATPTTLASFGGANGSEIYSSLIMDSGGDLFGMAYIGGSANDGTLFEIVKTATGYDSAPLTLASFTGADGINPHGTPVMDAQGDIFGVAQNGGANNDGTVFELVKTATGYASAPLVLASFNGANGSDLENVTLDAAGNLFGVAFAGGSTNSGTVFEIAKTAAGYAGTPVVLLNFDGANGAAPHGSLIIDGNGDLIGTTEAGGSGSGGVVFEISGVATVQQSAAGALAAWKTGQMPQHALVSDLAAAVQTDLDGLQSLVSAGRLSGIDLTDSGTPTISITALQATQDAAALKAIGGVFDLAILAGSTSQTIAGVSGMATTVVFSGTGSQYSITPAGDGSGFTIAGNGVSDQVKGVQALRFADHTDIVASAMPAVAGAVSSAQITELYGAVFGRTPDLGGLSFYETYAKALPATGFAQYAEFFLSSPEYLGSHNYAQSTAGDTQFIEDSYQNLLHRTASADEVNFYLTKVLEQPGSQLQTHAQMLVYFSQSQEFLGDVQVTAQSPTSAQHWLVLV